MKKTLAFILCLLTIIGFTTGCGNNTTKDEAESTAESTAELTAADIEVGGYIKFGSYEQDNNTSNGKETIEWLVLEKKDGKALVISKYALDFQPYHTSDADVTWETCSLRKWLNDDFLNVAFSNEEQARIPTVTVSADKHPSYDTDPGNKTQDKVFLLGYNEAKKYFDSDEARLCVPTDYVVAQGAFTYESFKVNGKATCNWSLRSPGSVQHTAIFVQQGFLFGQLVVSSSHVVRPALWIDLNA